MRALMEHFGEDIINLEAHGSVTTTNQTAVEELREFGFVREQETNHRININYTQLQTDDQEPVNPLDAQAREEINKHLHAVLDSDSLTVDPDLSVTALTVQVTDDKLQEVTPAQSSEFDLHFVADKAEQAVREQTQRLNEDRGLYSELGFNIHNLNLRSVVETGVKFSEQGDGQYFKWQGPEHVRLQGAKRLAIRINDRILPDEYGILKPYIVADDQILEIDEDDLNTENLPEGVYPGGEE
jgi:hypothetical protein